MALHTPTVRAPGAIQLPSWLLVPALVLIVLLAIGVLSVLFPPAQTAAPNDAYQQYRADERSMVLDSATLQTVQDYRAGEREMK